MIDMRDPRHRAWWDLYQYFGLHLIREDREPLHDQLNEFLQEYQRPVSSTGLAMDAAGAWKILNAVAKIHGVVIDRKFTDKYGPEVREQAMAHLNQLLRLFHLSEIPEIAQQRRKYEQEIVIELLRDHYPERAPKSPVTVKRKIGPDWAKKTERNKEELSWDTVKRAICDYNASKK